MCTISNLKILDVHGKNVEFELLENIDNQILISIRNTASGIYLIHANCSDGKMLEVEKLIIK